MLQRTLSAEGVVHGSAVSVRLSIGAGRGFTETISKRTALTTKRYSNATMGRLLVFATISSFSNAQSIMEAVVETMYDVLTQHRFAFLDG